jgi:hypothetical protein
VIGGPATSNPDPLVERITANNLRPEIPMRISAGVPVSSLILALLSLAVGASSGCEIDCVNELDCPDDQICNVGRCRPLDRDDERNGDGDEGEGDEGEGEEGEGEGESEHPVLGDGSCGPAECADNQVVFCIEGESHMLDCGYLSASCVPDDAGAYCQTFLTCGACRMCPTGSEIECSYTLGVTLEAECGSDSEYCDDDGICDFTASPGACSTSP